MRVLLYPDSIDRLGANLSTLIIEDHVSGGVLGGHDPDPVWNFFSGGLAADGGPVYHLMVLPQVETMTAGFLEKIRDWLKAGATTFPDISSGVYWKTNHAMERSKIGRHFSDE